MTTYTVSIGEPNEVSTDDGTTWAAQPLTTPFSNGDDVQGGGTGAYGSGGGTLVANEGFNGGGNTLTVTGATLNLSGSSGGETIVLNNSSLIFNGVGGGTNIQFGNGANSLQISPSDVGNGTTVSGINEGDTIGISGQEVSNVSYNNGTLNITTTGGNNYNLNVSLADETSPNFSVVDGQIVQGSVVVCFVSGTLIRTLRGDIAVENLALGDLVLTASGRHRPIIWLGHRTIDCNKYGNRSDVRPVRIQKDAFGKDKPERDLFVSSGHSICVDCIDETLIPVSSLINGSTISDVDFDKVTYWHVELDEHDVLFANGLPAESYMNCGNRAWFWNGKGVVHLNRPGGSTDFFCRPYFSSGPVAEACHLQLRERAKKLDWAVSSDMDIHLVVDGLRIDPLTHGDAMRFLVPHDAEDVFLISETFVPAWWQGNDRRRLGICVAGLQITDGLFCDKAIDLADRDLTESFYNEKSRDRSPWRWTNGCAKLPRILWQDCKGDFFLHICLYPNSSRRWIKLNESKAPAKHDGRLFSLNAA